MRIPGRMPGACVLHAYVPVFPCHVQPLQGGYVTKHQGSPLHRCSPPSYLPIAGGASGALPLKSLQARHVRNHAAGWGTCLIRSGAWGLSRAGARGGGAFRRWGGRGDVGGAGRVGTGCGRFDRPGSPSSSWSPPPSDFIGTDNSVETSQAMKIATQHVLG